MYYLRYGSSSGISSGSSGNVLAAFYKALSSGKPYVASGDCKLFCLSWRQHREYCRHENPVKNGEYLIFKEKIIRSFSGSSLPVPVLMAFCRTWYIFALVYALVYMVSGMAGLIENTLLHEAADSSFSRFHDVSLFSSRKRRKHRHFPAVRCTPSGRKSEPCVDICPPCGTWSHRADDFVCNSPEDMILYTVSIYLFAKDNKNENLKIKKEGEAVVELDQFKSVLATYTEPLAEVKDSLDLANKEQRVEELEREMEAPDFWDNAEVSQKKMKELKDMKDDMETYQNLVTQMEDMETMIEMGYEENDPELIPEIQEMLDQFQTDFDNIRVKTLLSGEYDSENAIVKLNAGAGGTEACDWCGMLYRMYSRWADRKGFSMEVLDYLDGDEAGVKSVTFQVNGENAYGYLKSEKGVHRLVRISPFNAAGKRQTSFVSCDVMPDIEKDLDVEINDEDIRIDTYRSSGAGGQHINKTSSAIRITHFPTGIVVQCQNERSQHMNKDKAMQMLKAKLYLLKQQEAEEKLSGIRGEVTDIGWGNQIRSYVMQPYTMVKDHRTNEETGNVDAVMDGSIDIFINAYLKWIALSKKTE